MQLIFRDLRVIVLLPLLFTMAALVLVAAPVGAQPASCSVADFTSGGVFDQTGYLACLSGGSGGGGSGTDGNGTDGNGADGNGSVAAGTPTSTATGLPATGSDVGRMLALGGGLLLVGAVTVTMTARRGRPITEAA